MTVENARQRGARLSAAPHVRTFLRLLAGNSRMNTTVAQRIPGLNWDPKHRLSSLKQVEEALDALIASHGECCPLPLPVDVQAELFPEVQHDPALMEQLAEGTGVRIGGALDPVGSSLEPGPGAYAALLRGLAETIAECAGG